MNKKILFWLAIISAFAFFLHAINDILFPFVFGLLIAYLFNPTKKRLEKLGLGRSLATALIIFTFVIVMGLALAVVTPILYDQASSLIAEIPAYQQKLRHELLPFLKQKFAAFDPQIYQAAKGEVEKSADISQFAQVLKNFLSGLLNSSKWVFNLLSLFFITPIVSFYILRDWEKFTQNIDKLLPRQYKKTILEQLQKINQTVSAYLRGQLQVCIILGIYYSISLSIIGLEFGFLTGFCIGLLCFIPYVGSVTGLCASLVLTYIQFDGGQTQILAVLGVFVFAQLVEGNYLTPKIVGDKIGVHPAWLIFGMLCGGNLLGFVGVIIAVPATAIIGVLLKFSIENYEKSEFYLASSKTKKVTKK